MTTHAPATRATRLRLAPAREVSTADATGDLTRWLAGATAAAALAETVLLRLATRTAIHIPGIQQIATPYSVFTSIGRFAYYTASVLVTATLALLLVLLLRHGRSNDAAAVGLVMAVSAAARFGLVTHAALAIAVGTAVALLSLSALRKGTGPRLAVALFGTAFLASALHAIAQDLSGSGALRPTSTSALLVVSEALALLAVLVLPRDLPVLQHRDLLVGAGAGALVLATFTANTSTSMILLLWTSGLAGYFPAAVYATAAGVLAATLWALRRHHTHLMVGLALATLGGIGLHSTYQSALVICGLALLATEPTRGSPAIR